MRNEKCGMRNGGKKKRRPRDDSTSRGDGKGESAAAGPTNTCRSGRSAPSA